MRFVTGLAAACAACHSTRRLPQTARAPGAGPTRLGVGETAALLFAAALAVSGCTAHAQTRPQPPAEVPQTTPAAPGTVQPTATLSGVIAPLQNVSISSSLTEPAAAVLVNEGQMVRAGQVLAVLASDDLEAELQAAIKNYNEAQANLVQMRYSAQLSITQGDTQVTYYRALLRQAQATLAQAEADYARDQMLYAGGGLAQQTLQLQATTVQTDREAVASARANLDSAVANMAANGTQTQGLQASKVASALAAMEMARAQIGQYRVQIARATIASPVTGVVVNRNLNPGEYPNGRTLFVLQTVSPTYAVLNAASNQTVGIPVGVPATISASSLGGVTGGGRVASGRVVAVLGQTTPGSTNFIVKAQIPNPNGVFLSGMAVLGKIALPKVSGIAVPVTAFVDDSHTSVLVLRGGQSQVVPVREIATDGTTSIVSGLSSGEQVLVNGQQQSTGGSAGGN